MSDIGPPGAADVAETVDAHPRPAPLELHPVPDDDPLDDNEEEDDAGLELLLLFPVDELFTATVPVTFPPPPPAVPPEDAFADPGGKDPGDADGADDPVPVTVDVDD